MTFDTREVEASRFEEPESGGYPEQKRQVAVRPDEALLEPPERSTGRPREAQGRVPAQARSHEEGDDNG